LRSIRNDTQPRVLWIDIICTNGWNSIEPEMTRLIYSKGLRNIVYIGDSNESTN
ncbi:hypothetical protein BU23DRAFT_437537, partial [Bimuria novae-zelandiae CBS 107.79]